MLKDLLVYFTNGDERTFPKVTEMEHETNGSLKVTFGRLNRTAYIFLDKVNFIEEADLSETN